MSQGFTNPFANACDLLSTLVQAEVAINTVDQALVAGKMHVFSDLGAGAADYNAYLPAVASNTGKLLGVRMAPALTKLVTINKKATDGANIIDGSSTRVMWANEVAILYCDGTTWTKVAGKTIPMVACAALLSDFTLTKLTVTAVPIVAGGILVNVGGMFAAGTPGTFTIRRAGNYRLSSVINAVVYVNFPTACCCGAGLTDSIPALTTRWCTADNRPFSIVTGNPGYIHGANTAVYSLSAAQAILIWGYKGDTDVVAKFYGSNHYSEWSVEEIPTW